MDKIELTALLKAKIEEWASDSCEEDYWTHRYIADDTIDLMTEAAMCVFRANESGQDFYEDSSTELKR